MSNTHALMQVDAFTDRPLGGNPCAVVFDAGDLDVDTMQAIAREMNLSETSFLMESDLADFRARYFTPAKEIPMAGHPTIATVYALVLDGQVPLDANPTQISLELQVGPIQVDIYHDRGDLERIVMFQQKPRFLSTLDGDDVLPLFGLSVVDALAGAPIQVVSTGTPQLMVPLKNHESLERINVRVAGYVALQERAGFFSTHLFCLQGATPEGHTFARHFVSPPDVFEDPFTGSATGGMAAYLWHHGLLDRPEFVAEQGHWMGRPGKAFVEVTGPRDDIESVSVGGQAALVMKGELMV